MSEGSASQRRSPSPQDGPAAPVPADAPGQRSADAPWHHARPAFDDAEGAPTGEDATTSATPEPESAPDDVPEPGPAPEAGGAQAESTPEAAPEPERRPDGETEPDGDGPTANGAGGERGATEDDS